MLQLQFNIALFGVSLALVGAGGMVRAALCRPAGEAADRTGRRGAGGRGGQLRHARRRATGPDEIGLLNRAFNRMTAQIEQQTDALVGANRQLDERRAFIEAVLQSITAGIISVDARRAKSC